MTRLEAVNLKFSYGDRVTILNNINLHVSDGEILLIKGKNGTGKSTLLECLGGILNGGEGIYLNDQHLKNDKSGFEQITYIMSRDVLYEYLTVIENINLFGELFSCDQDFYKQVNHYMELLDLDQYKNYLVKSLSQGTRHKVYLSIMLSKKSDVILIDEPFTALDGTTQEFMIDNLKYLVRECHKAIVLVTHIDKFAKLATRVFEL